MDMYFNYIVPPPHYCTLCHPLIVVHSARFLTFYNVGACLAEKYGQYSAKMFTNMLYVRAKPIVTGKV